MNLASASNVHYQARKILLFNSETADMSGSTDFNLCWLNFNLLG